MTFTVNLIFVYRMKDIFLYMFVIVLLWQLVSCEKTGSLFFLINEVVESLFTAAFALCVCTGWDAEELG